MYVWCTELGKSLHDKCKVRNPKKLGTRDHENKSLLHIFVCPCSLHASIYRPEQVTLEEAHRHPSLPSHLGAANPGRGAAL